MKYKIIYIPIILGIISMVIAWIVGDIGSLLGFVCSGASLFLFGIAALLSAVILGKNVCRRDYKFTIVAVLLSIPLLFIGGQNLVSAGVDSLSGPKNIQLRECTVSKTVSLLRIFKSYYLEGIDGSGNERRFSIDKDTYKEYEDFDGFSINVLGWEQSGVVKRID